MEENIEGSVKAIMDKNLDRQMAVHCLEDTGEEE